MRGKFAITPFYTLDYPELGIASDDGRTHTAIATYNGPSAGNFRSPFDSNNWTSIGGQSVRALGKDMFVLCADNQKDFGQDNVTVKLTRDKGGILNLSSSKQLPSPDGVYLPFTFPLVDNYSDGYDIEFDYFRRDQILLSTIDVVSSEFYIFWTGGDMDTTVVPAHSSSLRIGLAWPSTDVSSPLYATTLSNSWGIESSPTYDQQSTYYEGLPYDFAFDYSNNSIYYETSIYLLRNTFNFETRELSGYNFDTELDRTYPSVPGVDGGTCRGLYCRAGREIRDNISIISEVNPATSVTTYYLSDNATPWPNLGSQTYVVTITQGSFVRNVTTTGGVVRVVGDVTQFLLPIGTTLPANITTSSLVSVSYRTIYMGHINRDLNVTSIITSKIAPGSLPFVRVFLQGRQGASLGGVWIGQKTSEGIKVEPFTPHRCTLSISDTGVDSHGEWASVPETDGVVKAIRTYTAQDKFGLSTAPTIDPQEDSLNTRKSIHNSPKKCGSFLTSGGANSAGIFTPSEYPIRWLTSDSGDSLATYYVSANTSTEINLQDIFNISAESIINDDEGNLATFFIARSLTNHSGSDNEIYLSLNYTEQ
jgi:hypothetical protein